MLRGKKHKSYSQLIFLIINVHMQNKMNDYQIYSQQEALVH